MKKVEGKRMCEDCHCVRYITEEYDGGIRITMKEYKEWVDENGEPQVFHKTDTVGFKSPLIKKGNK